MAGERKYQCMTTEREMHLISSLIDPLRAAMLFDDLRRIGSEPSEAMFANAPVLSLWKIVAAPALGLSGKVNGHPHLMDGHRINTSQLFYVNPDRGIARTYNRWYRLNQPAGNGGH
jgi:hypothetical protein